MYEKTLKLMIKEIEKCDKNLNGFLAADDMRNFCIEVHSMKGALANIGATELSAEALELEKASDRGDAAFCALHLPPLLEKLGGLNQNLRDAFSAISQNDGPIEIPPEFPPVFEILKEAFAEMDIVTIDREMERLNSLNPAGALKEAIERIKDAVLVMDYDEAAEVIRKISNK
jgi:HPt (histidine-containing phosphotransfer) domain-containing protein